MQFKATTDKFSAAQLFIGFNVIFLLAVGTLILIRSFNDLYAPLPLNIATVAPICAAWVVVITVYVFLFLCLRHKNQLENLGAVLMVAGFCELVFFTFITIRVYTAPLLNHVVEENKKIIKILKQASEDPTSFRTGNFVLVNATFRWRVLGFQYTTANAQAFYDSESMRAPLKERACEYLSAYSRYDSLLRVAYTFTIDAKNSFGFGFTSKDCVPPPSGKDASTVPSLTPMPAPREAPDVEGKEHAGAKSQGSSTVPIPTAPISDQRNFHRSVDDLNESIDKLQESLNLFTREVDLFKENTASRANHPPVPAPQVGNNSSPQKSQ